MTADHGHDLCPADWARMRAALERAIASDEPRRVLRDVLADQPALLARGEALLALDEGPLDARGGPLDARGGPLGAEAGGASRGSARGTSASAATRATPLERVAAARSAGADRGRGIAVGPWVTLRELGAGGMGTVYLAVRADGAYDRQVALKLIRPHLATGEVLARFRRERQVQANLVHPGIVRMLDGGATDDGAPYYVMEHVDGVRIDEFCDEHRLTIAERVALFRRVVEAVDHAHRQLVVHRDLKPSNILVTADGAPKLLDFGIAKVLDPEKLSRGGDVTREVMGFLTPAYASPEQLRGRSATTASDIYSLGVLLYVLLTGRTPHETSGLSPAEIERVVAEEPPTRPSDAVATTREVALVERRATTRLTPALVAERRRAVPRDVRRALRGDLDRIVLHCMHKEPQRRYASAAALGEDLDRHLAGRPILARPDSLPYRAGKFLRRNRGPVAAAGLVIALLSGGLGLALHQNQRIVHAHGEALTQKRLADTRLGELRTLRRRMVDELDRVLLGVPGALEASEKLMQVVIEHLDVEAAAAGDDLALLAEIGGAYSSLGRVYFAGRGAHLGRADAARRCFERAGAALQRVRALAPEDLSAALAQFKVQDDLAALAIEAGDLTTAHRLLVQAFEALGLGPDGLLARHPRLRMQVVMGYDALARVLQAMGRYPEAVAAIETAIATLRDAIEREPAMRVFLEGQVATEYVRRADLATLMGDPERALAELDEAAPWLEAIRANHGGTTTGAAHWIIYNRKRAQALAALGDSAATDAFRAQLESARLVAAQGRDDVRAQLDLAATLVELGDHLVGGASRDEGLALGAEALAFARDLEAARPTSVAARVSLARAEIAHGEQLLAVGARLEAGELLWAGLRRAEQLSEHDPAAHYLREFVMRARLARGRLYAGEATSAADPAARARALGEARAAFERVVADATAMSAAGLGGAQRDRYATEARDELALLPVR